MKNDSIFFLSTLNNNIELVTEHSFYEDAYFIGSKNQKSNIIDLGRKISDISIQNMKELSFHNSIHKPIINDNDSYVLIHSSYSSDPASIRVYRKLFFSENKIFPDSISSTQENEKYYFIYD